MKTKIYTIPVQHLPHQFALCAGVVSAFIWLSPSARAADEKAPTPAASAAEVDRTESTYPQTFKSATHEIVKYQPQIDEWKDFKLIKARMAVSIQKIGSEDEPKYLSIQFEADTVADQEERVVHIGPRRVRKLIFVDAKDKAEEEALKKILLTAGDGQTPIKVDLDAMVANVERAAMMNQDVKVNFDPPPIFYSNEPAVLVAFMGEPDFKAVDEKQNKVLFALNTNWDILMDVASSTYYLLIEDGWLKSKDLAQGPWELVDQLPASFSTLPDDDNWTAVRAALKAKPFETPPMVFVSKQPGEIIETEGAPKMSPISGTKLMYITNTESDIFFLSTDANYYYLVEGRWFRSKQLTGGWKAATLDLPTEFAKIPEDHEKSYVLASVQGTAVADQAAVMASIPETATVNRADLTVTVKYDGDPKFELIKGSSDVQYAVNTENDVFLSNTKYYCCYQGVWFISSSPLGPWVVCDNVDKAIYTIPSDSPQYNVTYVQVYNSTPTTVQVGYTSGYTGQYLVRGLLVFGAGYWLGSHHSHYHWYRPSYIGWGCGARWGWHGGYHRPCRWGYGPYGGCVRPTPYRGGRYHRPHHRYGHHRPGHARPGYNPWNRPGNRPVAGRPVPYGSWGNKGVKRDNRMARDRYSNSRNKSLRPVSTPSTRPNLRPSTRPGTKPGTGIGGTPGTRPGIKPGTGPSTRPGTKPGTRPSTLPATRPSTRPDVYVGKDGGIYKKDKGGQWQQRDKSGWKDSSIGKQPSTRPGGNNPSTRPTTRPSTKPTTRPTTRPSTKPTTRPTTRPTTKPTTRPTTKPTTRPTTKPTTRPTTKPTTRPTTKPTTRPTTSSSRTPSYSSNRGNSSKLNWDSSSRNRASSSQYRSSSRARSSSGASSSARSRTSSSRSRSGGGSRGGRR